MSRSMLLAWTFLGSFAFSESVAAQDRRPPPRRDFGRPGGRGTVRPGRGGRLRLVEKFDDDGNGQLNVEERAKAREYVKRNGVGRAGPRVFRRGGPAPEPADLPREPERLAPGDVTKYPDRPLYDPRVLRTLFLEFPQKEWEAELADFYRTDVEIPADLTVDGRKYPNVGVRFRGN